MEAIVVLVLLSGLAAASLRWSHDSRPGFDPTGYDEVKGRIDGLLAQARLDALIKPAGPTLPRQLAGTVGVWLVATGHRLQSYGDSVVMPSRFAATSGGSIQSGL
jgi:hypothetical protein